MKIIKNALETPSVRTRAECYEDIDPDMLDDDGGLLVCWTEEYGPVDWWGDRERIWAVVKYYPNKTYKPRLIAMFMNRGDGEAYAIWLSTLEEHPLPR